MVREAYSQEKNIAAIYQQYENIFKTKLKGKPLSGHHASLKRCGKNWMHINHCLLMLRFKEGKGKNSKLLNFFLILILNMLRPNIVYLLAKSYHLSVMFMLVFSTLIYNPFHLGMIVRIFLHFDPQDKVEMVLLFEVEDEV